MSNRKFIMVEALENKHHIIPVDSIIRVKTEIDGENKSKIYVSGLAVSLLSTETAERIYFKLKYC